MRPQLLTAALLFVTSLASADPWTVDPAHSRVGISVPHMVVSSVEGRFHDVKATIDRRDFGLNWNKALDKGGVLVGEEVTIDVQLELNK